MNLKSFDTKNEVILPPIFVLYHSLILLISLPLSISLFHSSYLSITLSFFQSLSLSLSFFLSFCHSLILPISLPLFFFLPISLSFSFFSLTFHTWPTTSNPRDPMPSNEGEDTSQFHYEKSWRHIQYTLKTNLLSWWHIKCNGIVIIYNIKLLLFQYNFQQSDRFVTDITYFINKMLGYMTSTRAYVPINIGGTVSHIPPRIKTFKTIQIHLVVFLRIAI